MYRYKFSIFTPCYNSSKFIHRVFQTLDSQTYRNFEWIVVNDASIDNTSELIQEYIKRVDFKVKFFDLRRNQMLAANYNLALSVAEGEIFFPHGHDDTFIPTVLEEYVNLLEKYDSDEIAGIVARCQTQYGDVPSPMFKKTIMNYWEYAHQHGRYVGEMPDCIKTAVLKKYLPFDTNESLLPLPVERFIGCDGYKSICYNKIVRTYYVRENETSMTNLSGKFIRSQRYELMIEINQFQYYYSGKYLWNRIKLIALYIRATILSNVRFLDSLKDIVHVKDRICYLCMYPIVAACIPLTKNGLIKKVLKKTVTYSCL